jgi:type VI secretion system secreted protein Hcp
MDAIFISFDKNKVIKGDSQIKKFENCIEVLSYSHGVSAQVTADVSNKNRTSGRPMHQDFSITKYLDQGTPKINQACCEGTVFKDVLVTIGRNDKGAITNLITYEMTDVVISSVSIGGGGGGKPVESLLLNYAKMTWIYYLQDDKGGTKKGPVGKWDLATNKSD